MRIEIEQHNDGKYKRQLNDFSEQSGIQLQSIRFACHISAQCLLSDMRGLTQEMAGRVHFSVCTFAEPHKDEGCCY